MELVDSVVVVVDVVGVIKSWEEREVIGVTRGIHWHHWSTWHRAGTM